MLAIDFLATMSGVPSSFRRIADEEDPLWPLGAKAGGGERFLPCPGPQRTEIDRYRLAVARSGRPSWVESALTIELGRPGDV